MICSHGIDVMKLCKDCEIAILQYQVERLKAELAEARATIERFEQAIAKYREEAF